MADDGGWPKTAAPGPFGPDGGRSRQALSDLHGVLGELERRLSASETHALRPESATALVQALDALARRLARQEALSEGRAAELDSAVAALAWRLETQARAQAIRQRDLDARLDAALAELAQVRDRRRPDTGPLRVILAMAGAAAALSVVGAGVAVISRPQLAAAPAWAPLSGADLHRHMRPSLTPGLPSPATTTTGAVVAARPALTAPALGDPYAAVAAALERGEASAWPRLTGLAEAGHPMAQLRLAALYDAGDAGLPRDLAAARLWTRRAAEQGERVAMHNLGLFLVNGEGGPKDFGEASVWFRRAAEKGVVDSQFNLGLLYEAGEGVQRNLREAYRWYAIAANAGDSAAREKQVELEGQLKPAERAGMDADAGRFRPGAPVEDVAPVIPPAATVAETQALLARQGYYVGVIDGLASPGLKAAAAAYLRDHPGVTPAS